MGDMKDRWLSVDDICKYLGISKDTVYKWIDIGGMPAHRLGRLWKFKKAEVDDWVKADGVVNRHRAVSKKGRPESGKRK